MKPGSPLSELGTYQDLLLEQLHNSDAEDCTRQYHRDLSPIGWHLGHCVYTETYWIREVVGGEHIIDDAKRQLYIPEHSVKADRGAALPVKSELYSWAQGQQRENREKLYQFIVQDRDHELLVDDYLCHFLIQHYAQHIETVNYVIAQRNLGRDCNFEVQAPIEAAQPRPGFQPVNGGSFCIGADTLLQHYDNECARMEIELEPFAIARRPVSNAELLGFIQEAGYERKELWSDEGWQWRSENGVQQPQHWRRDNEGHYFGTDAGGPHALKENDAASGLSYHEAGAIASWAKATLPHEYQWEAAKKKAALEETGRVWEWCENQLHPYSGFEAFPYDGYSLPWFDNGHYTLRGHSHYTLPPIRRDSFRNFYQADKRHFPAGVRLTEG